MLAIVVNVVVTVYLPVGDDIDSTLLLLTQWVVSSLEAEAKQASATLKKLSTQEDRVTAGYVGEVMGLERYKGEMEKLSQRRVQLEQVIRDLEGRKHQERDSRQALAHLKSFCQEVSVGLDAMTFEERQQLLRLVIDQVTVDNEVAHIDTRIPGPSSQGQLRLRDPERREESVPLMIL